MKKLFVLLSLISAFSFSKEFNYSNGDYEQVESYVKNIKNGPFKYVYKNGNILEGNYTDGIMNGDYTFKTNKYTLSGKYVNGKREGLTILNFKNGDTTTYTMFSGVINGNFKTTFANGDVEIGTYRNNKKEGKSTLTLVDGTVEERVYENNILNGPFVITGKDIDGISYVLSGDYIDGVKEGPATSRSVTGTYVNYSFVNGEINGPYIEIKPNGYEYKGTYVDGLKNGTETVEYINYYESRTYKNGVLNGKFLVNNDMDSEISYSIEGNYVNGKREGKAIFRFSNGEYAERTYTNDILTGPYIYHMADGSIETGNLVNGLKDGKAIYTKGNETVEREYLNDIRIK